MKLAQVACVAGAMLLGACTTVEEQAMDSQVSDLTPCEKLQALITGHGKGFPVLRTTKSTTRYMDIWRARYHLVGDSCQVWGWGEDKFSYVCTLTEPNKDVAMEHFNLAKERASTCLGASWKVEEGPRKEGEGVRARFTKQGSSTAVSVLAVASPTLFKTEWRTYYFVGDPSDAL